MFAQIEKSLLKNKEAASAEQILREINDSNDYKSLQDIIEQEKSTECEGKARIFKIKQQQRNSVASLSDHSQIRIREHHSSQAKRKNQIFRIKVRQQRYKSEVSYVVYLSEVTKKIRDKLLVIEQLELRQQQMQAMGYRATLNHELRTPIESCIFLLNKLLDEISLQAKDRKVAR